MIAQQIRGAAMSLVLPLTLALTAAPGFAATPATGAHAAADGATHAMIAQKRAAVQGVSADALAILAAIQSDPSLLPTLARDPQGAEAVLRRHGATHAEHIVVSHEGADAGLRITITITIDHVVIVIRL